MLMCSVFFCFSKQDCYRTVAGGSPYGVTFGGAGAGAGGVYAPPPYEQLQHHQAIPALSQQLPVSCYNVCLFDIACVVN